MADTPNGLDTATSKEVAEYLRTSEMGLAQLRYKGNGPKFVRVGKRKVIYRWADVLAYLDANTMTRTDDHPKGAA
ncbi:helix-turn-helix transcriptional regulator [Mycolicibacterium brumae]|uniref:DNA-binding protein n=1 Tax=Mycolicibacterium brumae TaxID=85968 RepID=A0A2G5PD53_9MYCO|nr:DNA-binding protein [Mycolicibacterium brumae]MCV7191868.1 DNA-binding protein [Mycolicibacterium brumae]PIB76255.1 DNA-binding protein [Mycolicibacterium brumae]UWW07174.1 DNA-binding protein [Mycolicibacterium brumae]